MYMTKNQELAHILFDIKNMYKTNQAQIAKQIGVSAPYLSDTLNGRYPFTSVLKDRLVAAYPDAFVKKEVPAVTTDTRPRVPLTAAAGSLTHAADGITIAQCEQLPVVHQFPRYDFTIRIAGDSMLPEYHSGDEVACLHVNEATFLQWGRVYVLDTEQGIIIKRIYDNGTSIRCVSYNPDFPDFNIPKKEIYSYSLVVASFRI